jgi:hypothetical protein
MIGLCGAQRTGKTTLAQKYALATKTPYVETDVSGTFARLGADPKRDYPLNERIELQREILKDYEELLKKAPFKFITDRTPVDMMAYMLADIRRENVTDQQGGAIMSYLDECLRVLNRQFTVLMVVQPGIPLVEAPGKAPASLGYMEHINTLCMGIVVSEKVEASHFYMPRNYLDLDTRLKALEFAVDKAAARHRQKMEDQLGAGVSVH